MSSFQEYKERRHERFRLGQTFCTIEKLVSDPEMKVALVPLTEGEYQNTLAEADKALVGDNPAGMAVRDEIQRKMVLFYSVRKHNDLTVKWFENYADVDEMEAADVNHLYDCYLELVHTSSPALVGLSEEDFEALKKALGRIEWSALSGQQWYAANRFLNSIRPLLPMDNFSGSPSTSPSTLKSTKLDSVEAVENEIQRSQE